MTVSLVIPWRPQASRLPAFEFVKSFYSELLADRDEAWELILCDSNPDASFNLAAARNAGARAAAGETLLIVDADSFAERSTICAALDSANDGRVHYCFDRFLYLNEHESAMVLDGVWPGRTNGGPHESSVMVVNRAAYWLAGGSDERFTQWGGEDNAFRAAAETMLGNATWHRGSGYTLSHDAVRQCPAEQLALVERYRRAYLNRDAMLKILIERGRHA
jgi:hypothetical protein